MIDVQRRRLVGPNSHEAEPMGLLAYAKIRILLITVAEQAGLPLLTVERALYKLAFRGTGMKWLEYGQELHRRFS